MRKHNYSLILTWILIIVLSLILVSLIAKQKNDKLQKKTTSTITNNITFPPNNPILNNNTITFSWDLTSESWSINLIKTNSWDLFEKEKIDIQKLEEKKIIDATNLAWETWDNAGCNDIKSVTEKTKCIDNSYSAKASKENNPDICNKISDYEQKTNCIDNYYNWKALKMLDYNLCKKITSISLKDSCNYSIIISIIESPDFKQWVEICDILTWENKIYCQNKIWEDNDWKILQISIDSLDIKSCDMINSESVKIKCLDIINFKLAISTKDINNCSKISNVTLKSQCNETLIKIN